SFPMIRPFESRLCAGRPCAVSSSTGIILGFRYRTDDGPFHVQRLHRIPFMTWNKKLVLVGTLEPARREELARTFPGLRIVDCSQARDRVAAEIEDAELVFGRVKPEEFERA